VRTTNRATGGAPVQREPCGPGTALTPSYGLGIGAIWAVWLGFVAALYPMCRWYGARRSPR